MRNRIWTAVPASTLLISQACYHPRVLTQTPPASAVYTNKTVNQFLLVSQKNVEVGSGSCASNAMQEVRVHGLRLREDAGKTSAASASPRETVLAVIIEKRSRPAL
jgi:hypothetical protein